jgi:hypothetical protein
VAWSWVNLTVSMALDLGLAFTPTHMLSKGEVRTTHVPCVPNGVQECDCMPGTYRMKKSRKLSASPWRRNSQKSVPQCALKVKST